MWAWVWVTHQLPLGGTAEGGAPRGAEGVAVLRRRPGSGGHGVTEGRRAAPDRQSVAGQDRADSQ